MLIRDHLDLRTEHHHTGSTLSPPTQQSGARRLHHAATLPQEVLPPGSATIVKASEIATVLVNSTARLHITRWFRACCKDQGKTYSCEKHPAERACKAPVRISSSLLDVLRPLNPTAKCSDTLSTCLLSQQDPRHWKDLESILVYFLW